MRSGSEKKAKRRLKEIDDEDEGFVRGSVVNYGKVANRHVDDERYEKHRQAAAAANEGPSVASSSQQPVLAPPTKVSAQMAAVMRVMAGKEERTIAEKLADSNRPTWEQYKKDNEDKLAIAGLDQKKMEAYRKELDEQRDKLLNRGTNHQKDKDVKKTKKKKKKRYRRSSDENNSSDCETSDGYSSNGGRRSHKRKRRKKKNDRKRRKSSRRHDVYSESSNEDRKHSSKHKKKKDKKRRKSDDESNSGDSFRLSTFFTQGSDDGDR